MIATIFDAIPQGDRHERGSAGEFFARKMLERAGYAVERPKKCKQGDLRVVDNNTGEFWNIEVKTARRRPDGKFAFQLVGTGNARTNCKHADYLMLVAVCGNGIVVTYLIPTRILARRKTITLPKNLNRSKWADYRVKRTITL